MHTIEVKRLIFVVILQVYFVHSYAASLTEANREWVLSVTDYGQEFIR